MNRFFFNFSSSTFSHHFYTNICSNSTQYIGEYMVILFGNWLTSHCYHEANMIRVSCMCFRFILDLRNVPNKNVERRIMAKTLEYLLFFDCYVRPALRIIVTNSARIFYFKLLVKFSLSSITFSNPSVTTDDIL